MNPITLKIERQDYTFRYIPAPRGNKYRLLKYPDENTEEAVGVVHAFYMADTPMQDDYGIPKDMSWDDGIALCKKLTEYSSDFDRYSDYQNAVESNELFLRLPTDYEWEWAAFGGEDFEYAGCTNVDKVAWHYYNIKGIKPEVKRKKPNGYGLYDMSGNVWEWTANWCDNNDPPKHQDTGPLRVGRGGSWGLLPSYARVAYRDQGAPGLRDSNLGVRLCFSANPTVLSKLQEKGLIK